MTIDGNANPLIHRFAHLKFDTAFKLSSRDDRFDDGILKAFLNVVPMLHRDFEKVRIDVSPRELDAGIYLSLDGKRQHVRGMNRNGTAMEWDAKWISDVAFSW